MSDFRCHLDVIFFQAFYEAELQESSIEKKEKLLQ